MKWTSRTVIAVAAAIIAGVALARGGGTRMAAQTRQIPTFQVDPAWPKVPSKWVLGLVSGVNVDNQDHVWVLHRPRTVLPAEKDKAAPALLEFDIAGNFIQAWGAPGPGYEWFDTEHGVGFDAKGNAFIAGSGAQDGQILKFTRNGKFLLQIGHSGQSKGNTDKENVKGAADVTYYAKTNEIFVADGYNNRRIIVFDADTGAFKRMWGAFGNVPTDPPPPAGGRRGRGNGLPPPDSSMEGPGADQFNLVHSARISSDGLLYVSDRANRRVQVFTPDGKYVTQVFLSRLKWPPSTLTGMLRGTPLAKLQDGLYNAGMTASRTAFSPDKEQRFLYVIDRPRQQIAILDRKSLEILGYFGGGIGGDPGQFYVLHDIAADSKGNVYTAEVNDNGGRRAQKFTYKGMAPAPLLK
jgi:DNA-binding beta-propeller fold protein YncE